MSTLRSSVRPKSSKQQWGTILEPEFGMGHQKMTEYEVSQTVDRLYYVPTEKRRNYDREEKQLSRSDLKAMVIRLTKVEKSKIPESDRRISTSSYKDMGVVSSFAWRGYN